MKPVGEPSKKSWSQKYNELPLDIRIIGSAMECLTRIQHLNFEKDRLKRRYNQSIKEINDHIKNCEKFLKELEQNES